jgi:hypothetical protein
VDELICELLALPVPLLLVAALALGLSRVPGRSLAEATNWGAVAILAGAIGVVAWVAVVWQLEDDVTTPPTVPQVVLELNVPRDKELAACAASGGVQMVYLEGAWKCVTAEQAG